MTDSKKEDTIKWHKHYGHMGVSPRELYMRQNGLCFLIIEGEEIFCSDGKDTAKTCNMLNPTFECVKCITNFTKRVIQDGHKRD